MPIGTRLTLCLAPLATLALGCGGGPTLAVGSYSLPVSDQLYVSKPTGYFCDTVPSGQIRISLVDFGNACPLDRKANEPDPRDAKKEHTELQIVLGGLVTHPLKDPYTLSKIDCTTKGDNGTAYFLHYPAGSTDPDMTIQVDSGTVKLDAYDATNKLPTTGKFDLTFGASKISGAINAYSCDG